MLTTVPDELFSLPRGRRGKSGVAEIRLSSAGERFHLRREVIALIEVAFITLTYYTAEKEPRPAPVPPHTALEKILKPRLG